MEHNMTMITLGHALDLLPHLKRVRVRASVVCVLAINHVPGLCRMTLAYVPHPHTDELPQAKHIRNRRGLQDALDPA